MYLYMIIYIVLFIYINKYIFIYINLFYIICILFIYILFIHIYLKGFPGCSAGKDSLATQETLVQFLGQEDLLEKG